MVDNNSPKDRGFLSDGLLKAQSFTLNSRNQKRFRSVDRRAPQSPKTETPANRAVTEEDQRKAH